MSFRPATHGDAFILYAWRARDEAGNDYPRRTTLEQHQAWLDDRIGCPLVDVLIWEERGWPTGMVRIDSNGELAFNAETDQTAHDMLSAALHHAGRYGGRLKATLDTGDPKALQLERAGFQAHPSIFLAYRP
jgi:hypothetical protein